MRAALRCLLCLCCAAAAGCERPAAKVDPPAAPAAPGPPRGAGVPFETGGAPDIRELEKVDLAAFAAGAPWCTKGRGGVRVHFAPGGDYAREGGGTEERGTWRVEEGRLSVTIADAPARPVDARAATVDGRQVLLLDGLLHGRCDP